MIDYSGLTLVDDNYFLVEAGCYRNCGDDGCHHCGYTGYSVPHEADLSTLLLNLAVAGALCAAYAVGWRARVNFAHNFSAASPPSEVWRPGCGREAPP